jgi:hypothetical protein
MQMQALDITAWIRLADERGLVATIDEIANRPLKEPVKLVPLEFSRMLLRKRPHWYPDLDINVVYAPHIFFRPFCKQFVPTSRVDERQCPWDKERPLLQLIGMFVDNDGLVYTYETLHSSRKDRQAESEQPHYLFDDTYTRYILWSHLEEGRMPLVYWRQPKYARP